jgi:hypothetical protein
MGVELPRHEKERPMIRTIPGQRKPGWQVRRKRTLLQVID